MISEATCQGCSQCGLGAITPCPSQSPEWLLARAAEDAAAGKDWPFTARRPRPLCGTCGKRLVYIAGQCGECWAAANAAAEARP